MKHEMTMWADVGTTIFGRLNVNSIPLLTSESQPTVIDNLFLIYVAM